MPWCPVCKKEYSEGIKMCSTCNSDLIEQKPDNDSYHPFFQAEEKSVADKLMDFFNYSGLKTTIYFDEENEVYIVSIPKNMEKQARKLYKAFNFVERERSSDSDDYSEYDEPHNNKLLDETSNETLDDETPSNISTEAETLDNKTPDKTLDNKKEDSEVTYIMKADKYKDYNSTVWTFLVFGFVGLIIVILNAIGILSFLSNIFSLIVMGALFLFFIYIGLSTHKKAKQLYSEIKAEDELSEKINNWLKDNLTNDFLTSTHNDKISDELNYIKQVDIIKDMIIKEYGKQNNAYLDQLIEEYYTNTFE